MSDRSEPISNAPRVDAMLLKRTFSSQSWYLRRSAKRWISIALLGAKGAHRDHDSSGTCQAAQPRFRSADLAAAVSKPYTALSLPRSRFTQDPVVSPSNTQIRPVDITQPLPRRRHDRNNSQYLPSHRFRIQSASLPSCLPQSAIAKLAPIPACTRRLSVATKFRMSGEFFF